MRQTSTTKPIPRWLRWVVFYLFGIFTFVVGKALIDLGIIESKWWLITVSLLAAYWYLFLKKTETDVEGEIKYDWDRKND